MISTFRLAVGVFLLFSLVLLAKLSSLLSPKNSYDLPVHLQPLDQNVVLFYAGDGEVTVESVSDLDADDTAEIDPELFINVDLPVFDAANATMSSAPDDSPSQPDLSQATSMAQREKILRWWRPLPDVNFDAQTLDSKRWQSTKLNLSDVSQCRLRMIKALLSWNASQLASGVNLVMYHMGSPNPKYGRLIQENNIRLFVSSTSYSQPAFYIFHILQGRQINPFVSLLPRHLSDHVCFVDYFRVPYDVSAYFVTLALLRSASLSFKHFYFINHSTRGPLEYRQTWMSIFDRVLDKAKNVAIIGPRSSCEMAPHIQTHMFGLPLRSLVPALQYQLAIPQDALESPHLYVIYAEVGFSNFFLDKKMDIASLGQMLASKGKLIRAKTLCPPSMKSSFAANESAPLLGQIFFKFGGGPMAQGICHPHFYLDSAVNKYVYHVRIGVDLVSNWSATYKDLLVWPESLCNGNWTLKLTRPPAPPPKKQPTGPPVTLHPTPQHKVWVGNKWAMPARRSSNEESFLLRG